METFVLGTAVKLTAILDNDLETGGVVTCTVYDSRDVLAVDAAAVTEVLPSVFQYIYQSTDNDVDGQYKVIFKITVGGYTTIAYKPITFLDVQP